MINLRNKEVKDEMD